MKKAFKYDRSTIQFLTRRAGQKIATAAQIKATESFLLKRPSSKEKRT